MVTKYTYSIISDTMSAAINSIKLVDQITDSSIIESLDRVDTNGDNIDVWFLSAITVDDQATLTALVGAHDGQPYPDTAVAPIDVIVDSQPAFTAKTTLDGKKLYVRTHGEAFAVVTGTNTLNFTVPYPASKITGIELLAGELGDYIDMYVLDDTSGTYSTVPNYTLNQFGFNTYIAKDSYKRESSYDADLYYGMRVSVVYNSQSDKTVYINYLLHEVKS